MFGADANWGRVLCALGYERSDGRQQSRRFVRLACWFADRLPEQHGRRFFGRARKDRAR
ncbi:MAG: hypothetical protein R2881_07165 [Eubacteriales bacterium]